MPNKLNVSMLEKAQDSLAAAKGVFVINYHGLTVKETQGLRRALSEAGAHMKVYKNNIVRIALANANLPEIQHLEGTCAYVFYENDPVDAAKVIKAQSEKLKKIEWIGALADGEALDAEGAKAYAELASRDELVAKLTYVLASPLSGIASVCAGPARGLATALDAVVEQKNAA